jgi:hypothetical protein
MAGNTNLTPCLLFVLWHGLVFLLRFDGMDSTLLKRAQSRFGWILSCVLYLVLLSGSLLLLCMI